MAVPMTRAAPNIEFTAYRSFSGFSLLSHSLTRLITPWVSERLPAVSNAKKRSPGFSKVNILRKVETRSIPALVRESDASTTPSSTRMPMQLSRGLPIGLAVVVVVGLENSPLPAPDRPVGRPHLVEKFGGRKGRRFSRLLDPYPLGTLRQ